MRHGSVSVELPVAVKYRKNGRIVCLGKVFTAPDGPAFGTPYKGRAFATPSLPAGVLRWLRAMGVTRWVIRFDERQRAYALPLALVDQVGTLRDGEWYVPFSHFAPCPYINWPFAEQALVFSEGGGIWSS